MKAEDVETVLAAFGQLARNEEFRIVTKIVNNSSGMFARKEAYTKESEAHIEKLKDTHNQLAYLLRHHNNLRLVNLTRTGKGFVEYEYIKGWGAEHEAFKSVVVGNCEKTIDIIDNVFDFIDSLSTKRTPASKTPTVKRINDIYAKPTASVEYANPGIVDLNLDNFIIDTSNKLVIFDYEWVFGEPLSADFIKTRILYSFLAQRSEAFGYLPSQVRPFRLLHSHDVRVFIPELIFLKYSKFFSKESLRKFRESEDIFQSYVNKLHKYTGSATYGRYAVEEVMSPEPPFPIVSESYRNGYESLLRQNDILQKELKGIKSSRSFKAIGKIKTAKQKVVKKLGR